MLETPQSETLQHAEQAGGRLAAIADAGEHGKVNRSLVRALATEGLLAKLFPPEGGVAPVDLCLIRQGLARTSTKAETAFALQGLGGYPILLSAPEAVTGRYLPGIATGELVPAFALTEPLAGSDAANLGMSAVADGADGFRLTGEKNFISNAPDADLYTVFARTGESGAAGVTAFLVEGDATGLSGQSISMIGGHPIGHLTFDGVYAPKQMILGEVGGGFQVGMMTLDLFRPSVGAFAVGMAEAALAVAVDHAKTRQAFGHTLSEFQAVSHQLAEMTVRIEAATLLVYRAASSHGQAGHTGLAAAAKLFATETSQYVVDAAIQILGARGLEEGHPLAHFYQEVRALRIYEGTSEIQRNIVARELLNGRWPR